jgi:hypothetical protein
MWRPRSAGVMSSIDATAVAICPFLPHIMAAERWRQHEGKKPEKGHTTLCGRTFCAIVSYLQGLWRNLRHIIWRKSATI